MLATKAVPKSANLEIRRRFDVGQEALFQAWTNPEALRAWFGPEGVVTQLAEVDLRVGGKYRVEMLTADNITVIHHGVYEEIVAHEKLVFTWLLQDQACEGSAGAHVETRVTVEFRALSKDQTDLHLIHEGLPTKKASDGHELGWNGCLDNLQRFATSSTPGD